MGHMLSVSVNQNETQLCPFHTQEISRQDAKASDKAGNSSNGGGTMVV